MLRFFVVLLIAIAGLGDASAGWKIKQRWFKPKRIDKCCSKKAPVCCDGECISRYNRGFFNRRFCRENDNCCPVIEPPPPPPPKEDRFPPVVQQPSKCCPKKGEVCTCNVCHPKGTPPPCLPPGPDGMYSTPQDCRAACDNDPPPPPPPKPCCPKGQVCVCNGCFPENGPFPPCAYNPCRPFGDCCGNFPPPPPNCGPDGVPA